MAVIKIGQWDIDKSSLSIKAIASRAKIEAQAIANEIKVQGMALESEAIDTAKDELNGLLDEGKKLIEKKIKEETGYTPQEIKYKTVQAYEQAKGAIDTQKEKIAERKKKKEEKKRKQAEREGKEYEEPRDTSMKVKKKMSIDDIVKKMPDEMYNAFFMSEILEVVDKTKTIVAQTRDIGSKAVDEALDQVKYIKDHFKKSKKEKEEKKEENSKTIATDSKYEKESDTPSYMTSEDSEVDTAALNSALLSELAKTKSSTRGEEDEKPDKSTTETADSALDMLDAIEPVLLSLKELFDNWKTNMETLRDDSGARDADLLAQNALRDSFGESVPAEVFFKSVTRGIDGLYDDEDDGSEDEEELPEYENIPYSLVSTDSSVAYVSDEPNTFSELDRIDILLTIAQKDCKLDEDFPLYSESTREDGGKVRNLEHAGNNKKELVDAIEDINDGQRL